MTEEQGGADYRTLTIEAAPASRCRTVKAPVQESELKRPAIPVLLSTWGHNPHCPGASLHCSQDGMQAVQSYGLLHPPHRDKTRISGSRCRLGGADLNQSILARSNLLPGQTAAQNREGERKKPTSWLDPPEAVPVLTVPSTRKMILMCGIAIAPLVYMAIRYQVSRRWIPATFALTFSLVDLSTYLSLTRRSDTRSARAP